MREERRGAISYSELVDSGQMPVKVRHQLRWLGLGLLGFGGDKQVGSLSCEGALYHFCLITVSVLRTALQTVSVTCSSTKPPTLLLAVTKAVTSSSINLSKSSIERGTGSGGEGAEASEAVAVAAAAPPPAPTAAIPAIDGCPFPFPLDCGEAPSTVEAMSSRREVAASSLAEAQASAKKQQQECEGGAGLGREMMVARS